MVEKGKCVGLWEDGAWAWWDSGYLVIDGVKLGEDDTVDGA